jgi:hypothetical protein
MLTSEARAPVMEIQDRLIDLYVQQDEGGTESGPGARAASRDR